MMLSSQLPGKLSARTAYFLQFKDVLAPFPGYS
jgi:hypothetical protein